MKTKATLLAASLLASTLALYAGPGYDHGNDHSGHDHGHDHEQKQAGPNGGRIITSVEPHLEIFMKADRFLQITVLDEENKATALDKQSVKLIGGSRTNPTRMTFTKNGNVLLSDKAVPAGNGLSVVLQIKTTPESKATIEKFYLNLSDCPSCDYLEYACTCALSRT